MDFGKRIKDLRMSRGWSAEELAERCGVSPATIYRYERGTISSAPVDKIAPIAEALGVSPAVIMGWGDDEKPETPTREDYAALGVSCFAASFSFRRFSSAAFTSARDLNPHSTMRLRMLRV